MSSAQKVIKYCAIAFAILLIVSIFRGIYQLGYIVVEGVSFGDNSKETRKYENVSSYLDIDLKYQQLKIVKGDSFKAESDSKYINVEQDGNKMIITETKSNIFKRSKNSTVTVYIPEDLVFDNVYIETGAGKIEIESIEADRLVLELGAGDTNIKKINASSAKIDTGAGKITIASGNLSNLNLDLGVGSASITASLRGTNTMDCGIGKFDLNLTDSKDNYTIKTEKGIGSISLNGSDIGEGTTGTGENSIKIEGGIGSINITTNEGV